MSEFGVYSIDYTDIELYNGVGTLDQHGCSDYLVQA